MTIRGPAEIPSPSDPAHSVILESEGCSITSWKNVVIVIWATQATMQLAAHLERTSTGFIGKHPEGISAVHVVVNGTPLPDAETRAELNRLTDKYAKDLACFGTVIEGSGFWASAMQSFVTGLHWVSRRPFKSRIGSSLVEIAGWLPAPHAERTGVKFTAAELVRVLTDARARVR
jgi:hypothetical protein